MPTVPELVIRILSVEFVKNVIEPPALSLISSRLLWRPEYGAVDPRYSTIAFSAPVSKNRNAATPLADGIKSLTVGKEEASCTSRVEPGALLPPIVTQHDCVVPGETGVQVQV